MSTQLRWALNIWPMVLGMLIVLGINKLEHWAMPVVEDFTVTTMTRSGQSLRLSGYMRKSRNCEFIGVASEGEARDGPPVSVPLVFRDSRGDDVANRPTGTQGWGPWSLELPLEPDLRQVTLTATHKCHPFWSTESHLLTLPVPGTAP